MNGMNIQIISIVYGPRVLTPAGICWAFVRYEYEREDGTRWKSTQYAVRD